MDLAGDQVAELEMGLERARAVQGWDWEKGRGADQERGPAPG